MGETNLLLIQLGHLSDVLLGSLLEVALSLSDVKLVAAFASELVDHSSSFALGVAAVCAFFYAILLIPTEERFWTVAGKRFGGVILNTGHNFHVEISKEHLFQIGMALVDNFNAQPPQFTLVAE